MRTFFIWVFGIVASGFIGMLLGDTVDRGGGGSVMGLIAGTAVFSCARLWLGPRT